MCNANMYLGLGSQQFVAVGVFSCAYYWSLVRSLGKFCTNTTSGSKRPSISDGFYIYKFVDDSHCQYFWYIVNGVWVKSETFLT